MRRGSGEKGEEKGEGRREKGEERWEMGDGRWKDGKWRREKGEGRREKEVYPFEIVRAELVPGVREGGDEVVSPLLQKSPVGWRFENNVEVYDLKSINEEGEGRGESREEKIWRVEETREER